MVVCMFFDSNVSVQKHGDWRWGDLTDLIPRQPRALKGGYPPSGPGLGPMPPGLLRAAPGEATVPSGPHLCRVRWLTSNLNQPRTPQRVFAS